MSETNICQEVDDAIADVLDGTAPAALFDHIAECDACRDKKHDAQRAAELVSRAGADFRAPEGFEARLVSALDERAGHAASGPQAVATRLDAELANAADPPNAPPTQDDGASPISTSADPAAPTTERMADKTEPSATPGSQAGSGARALDDVPRSDAVDSVDAHAKTVAMSVYQDDEAANAVQDAPPVGSAPPGPSGGAAAATTDHAASSGAARERAASRAANEPREVVALPATVPAAAPPTSSKRRGMRRSAFFASAAVAAAAAAVIGFYVKGRAPHTDAPDPKAPWTGSVAQVSRASADKTGGLEVCNAMGACTPAAEGVALAAGSILRTDARTRARLALADGTEISIDRASELELGKQARAATLKHGGVVADVAHLEGASAHLRFPGGDVEILGTKVAVTASEDRASIQVARGEVRVTSGAAKPVSVRAGEEATILRSGEATVASSSSIADNMEWSDKTAEEVDAPVLRGLGELRARKPGETKEKDHAVRLAKHSAKVRIVDVVARTEVDETFTNDTDEELEGIFRFPMPPGAQIERLALEVDGKLVDGSFVDRDRGAAIWRGVIHNAAPKAPKPKEEIIWVPGPWRDPALLEWQRGGRFELKIFPIPKRGSRRVVLAYTQTVDQTAGVRRFLLPLAHDTSGTTTVGSFDLDVQVLGADKAVGLQTRGYELANATTGEGERRTMHADQFVPSGDLTVEYALPDRDKEVTAWAYTPTADAVAKAEAAQTKSLATTGKKPVEQQAAADAAASILADRSAYVAIAIRPKLPRWKEARERVHAIVVDSSRSMFGERFARATRLASSIVREMDRRDSFVLLACDTTCRSMGESGVARPEAPGAPAAENVERFLSQLEPDGGSDLSAAVSAARAAAGSLGGKELRVIYLGDGTPTVGPTRAAHLESAVRSALPNGDAAVVAVALGADADTVSLEAMARGGGGVLVPYVPGQKVSTAALDVLAAAYGEVLRDPEIELPSGLSQVTPAHLDPMRSGGETIVVARMSGNDLSGTLRLHGKVAGERFEQSYPIKVVATTKAGNAFVPRLFAAAKIGELDREGGEANKPVAIALSRTFQVASRFTSLLVLESETMFKAFGVDRNTAGTGAFTGDDAAESSSADGEVAQAQPDADGIAGELGADKAKNEAQKGDASARRASGAHASAGGGKSSAGVPGGAANPYPAAEEADPRAETKVSEKAHGPMGNMAQGAPAAAAPAPPPPPAKPMASAAPRDLGFDDLRKEQPALPRSPEPPFATAPAKKRPASGAADDAWDRRNQDRERSARRRGFVPMKKVFDRKVAFDTSNSVASQSAGKLIAAEAAFRAAPDSRDKTVDLFALYSTSGRLGDAQELTAKWAGRDALDPEALLARSDLAARQGDRARAVRILGGLVDVRPNDRAMQTRLADLHDAAGEPALACEHRITLAEIASSEPVLVADAARCARAQGMSDLASRLLADSGPKVSASAERLLATAPKGQSPLLGDVQVTAEWTGGADVDVALVDVQGRRTSWLGTPVKSAIVSSRDVTSPSRESLAIANLPQGSYVVEVSRSSGGDAGAPIAGNVTLRVGNETRKVPFVMTGARAEVGTVRVFFTSHLVPADSVGWSR